jgi:hypothetical protein
MRFPYKRLLCDLEFHDQRFTEMDSFESKTNNCWARCKPKKKIMLVSLALAFMLASSTFAQSAPPPRPDDSLSSDQAREETAYTLGVQAYLWGIPLVDNYETNQAGLKVGAVDVNNFRKYTKLKTAKDRFIVTPNNVTIDAYAAFDVTEEPVVIYVPALSEPRWYIVQLGDFFDEIRPVCLPWKRKARRRGSPASWCVRRARRCP